MINTTFSGNMAASEGGAFNLAGTFRLVNCSFMDNISDEGIGPVIANIGYVSGISNCSILGNAFSCERGEFLGYELMSWKLKYSYCSRSLRLLPVDMIKQEFSRRLQNTLDRVIRLKTLCL